MTKLRTEVKTIKKKYYLSRTLILPKKKNERQESTNAFFSYSPSFVLNWNTFSVIKIAFQIETRSTWHREDCENEWYYIRSSFNTSKRDADSRTQRTWKQTLQPREQVAEHSNRHKSFCRCIYDDSLLSLRRVDFCKFSTSESRKMRQPTQQVENSHYTGKGGGGR